MKPQMHRTASASLTFSLAALLGMILTPLTSVAQGPGTEDGQWTFLGGDAWHTRYSPASQINASNFEDLQIAWQWNAASFGPSTSRATPTYVDGKLITVTGDRRHVVALDPGTGEVLWTFTEPNGQASMGVAIGKDAACNGWMDPSGTSSVGNFNATDGRWTNACNLTCDKTARLYCFQQ